MGGEHEIWLAHPLVISAQQETYQHHKSSSENQVKVYEKINGLLNNLSISRTSEVAFITASGVNRLDLRFITLKIRSSNPAPPPVYLVIDGNSMLPPGLMKTTNFFSAQIGVDQPGLRIIAGFVNYKTPMGMRWKILSDHSRYAHTGHSCQFIFTNFLIYPP